LGPGLLLEAARRREIDAVFSVAVGSPGRPVTAALHAEQVWMLDSGLTKAEFACRPKIGRLGPLCTDDPKGIMMAGKKNRPLYQLQVTLEGIHPPSFSATSYVFRPITSASVVTRNCPID
jgi:hypothetical protein